LSSFAAQVLEELDAERTEHAREVEGLQSELAAIPKEMKTRERDSASKIIAGIIIAAYGLDPQAKRSDIVPEVVGDLERLGIPVSDETIRKFLKLGIEQLPKDAKITAA
jgi:hypothetical protein